MGNLYDPKEGRFRRAWVFVLGLGFSRHMLARIVFAQNATAWLTLHVEAFEELGGVPAVVVPDNLKAALIRAAFGADGPTALIITSNRGIKEWPPLFCDELLARAAMDRLLHHGHMVTMEGESYRYPAKRRRHEGKTASAAA